MNAGRFALLNSLRNPPPASQLSPTKTCGFATFSLGKTCNIAIFSNERECAATPPCIRYRKFPNPHFRFPRPHIHAGWRSATGALWDGIDCKLKSSFRTRPYGLGETGSSRRTRCRVRRPASASLAGEMRSMLSRSVCHQLPSRNRAMRFSVSTPARRYGW